MPVWLRDAQVDEAGHRQTHVEPVAEAEVVDELEDVLHAQEDQTHQPLQAPANTHNVLRLHNGALEWRGCAINGPHVEQQRRYGCVTLQVNQAQAVGEVALSGAHEKQPA